MWSWQAAALTLLTALMMLTATQPTEEAPTVSSVLQFDICMTDREQAYVRALLFGGLDDAMRKHMSQMFGVWMKDGHGQPARARTGLHQGITAYLQVHRNVEAWSPPACQ
jgi:hypothetical protein